MGSVAETLFGYLHDVIYNPANAVLNVDELPEDFHDLGSGLRYFAECVMETKTLAQALSKGDLHCKLPPPCNEIAAPLKSLYASLKHLTWQTQQVAKGDYQQSVNFMGDFSEAFNSMSQQLQERQKIDTQEKSTLYQYINMILSNVPDIILVFDTEGKAVLASEVYIRSSKINSAEEIRGKSFGELFAPITAYEFLQDMDVLFHDALVSAHTVKTEQNIDFAQDGGLRTYSISITPLYENEKIMGTMIVFHDITEIIQARQEAEKAREIAEQSTKAKSEFLARMSHEMRTPMNAIIGMTAIGKITGDNERMAYCLDKINEASRHLLGVINDILDMSKIEADKLELSFSEFDFRNMIKQVQNIIHLHSSQKDQSFIIEIDKNIPGNIISDKQRLAQVITNLLSNAVKFTPKNGAVSLSAKKISDSDGSCAIRFAVKDNGIGISEEQQEHLFNPFEQADGSISRKFGGTGLGLAISKRIVEMMGGNIWVESELGKGASFIFEIIVKKGAETKETKETKEDITVGEGIDEDISNTGIFTGKNILIAEDVDINREIIGALLEPTGIKIEFAFDGEGTVREFLSNPDKYDLILMDIHMPLVNGYEATEKIRASGLPAAEKIPIIAMTANVFREDVERCLAAGMNSHLGKPVDIHEVIERLKKYLL